MRLLGLRLSRRGVATLLVVSALLTTGFVLAVTLPTEVPVAIVGQVSCSSGRPVVGVWIEATRGGSDWAEWRSQSDMPASATITFTLPFGGSYSVHVGCGGSRFRWQTANGSQKVDELLPIFVCDDIAATSERNGTCTLTH